MAGVAPQLPKWHKKIFQDFLLHLPIYMIEFKIYGVY